MKSGNAITARLGLRHPIVQGPFGGGLSTVELTSLVSNLGGLGSFGAHSFAAEKIGDVVAAIRLKTSQPFAVNLWVSDDDTGQETVDPAVFDATYTAFEPWFRELGLDRPDPPSRYHPSFEQQFDALLAARPPVFSFVFGIPDKHQLAACRARGIVTIGAATSVAEALAVDAAGVDMVVASGMEAGGHRPSFLSAAEDSLHGTFALVQLVSARVAIPVIAAGGIADARGVRAATMLGASAVQVGTAFLACAESGTDDRHRELLFSTEPGQTRLTRAFSGRLARGIRTAWTEQYWARKEPASFPIQSWFSGQLRQAALTAGRTDLISAWSGQIAPHLKHRRAADLIAALVAD